MIIIFSTLRGSSQKKPQVATCGLGCVSIERSLAQVGVAKKVFTKPASTKSKAAKIHAAEKVAKAKPTSSAASEIGHLWQRWLQFFESFEKFEKRFGQHNVPNDFVLLFLHLVIVTHAHRNIGDARGAKFVTA